MTTTKSHMGPTEESEYFRSKECELEMRLSNKGWLLARLDGRRFSKLTAGLTRPFDSRFHAAMAAAAQRVADQFKADLVYTHSDEVTLVWRRPSDAGFGGRVVKLATSLAAAMSVEFFVALTECGLLQGARPTFDCRLVELDADDVRRNLHWRAGDALRNAAFGAARMTRTHVECESMSVAELAAAVDLDADEETTRAALVAAGLPEWSPEFDGDADFSLFTGDVADFFGFDGDESEFSSPWAFAAEAADSTGNHFGGAYTLVALLDHLATGSFPMEAN